MSQNRYLFPARLSRRELLHAAGLSVAGAALAGSGAAQEKKPPVRIGQGHWTYTLVDGWGELPEGMKYGFGCAMVVDSRDRVYVTSRSANPCVAVFDRRGRLLETWSNDFAEKVGYTPDQVAKTAHGLYWSKEGRNEYLYFTENAPGNRIYKTDLKGKVLYEIGAVSRESSTAQKFTFTNPTDVAVAPNGDIYVVDGYGSQLVHRFDKSFRLIRTIGGRGRENGKFNVCHGVWVSTMRDEPEVYIADRANNRLEVYSLALDYQRTLGEVRLPCCFYEHRKHLYVPELGSRVTVLDEHDHFVARLGDGQGLKAEDAAANPDKFITPHALTVDSRGDLYVIEWVPFGRPRKFRHTPV
ncbi:MAG: hypothetical protein FJX77_13145 [Armatimonadetes bacterium]|nr:hypothetical protein [Armatimonadota bacterium]